VSWTAAHITNFAALSQFVRETSQNFSVEGLALKLAVNPAGILVRNTIVTLADCL
jgi:hypothetical protein